MKSVWPVPNASAPAKTQERLHAGYPLRVIVIFACALALVVIWLVIVPPRGMAWLLSAGVVLASLAVIALHTRRLLLAREQSAQATNALDSATTDIPVELRTRMPLLLVTGDKLAALFDRGQNRRHAYVGEGAIWLRVERPQDMPRLAVAVRQWRDGRAPDGVVLAVMPASHDSTDSLAQKLRIVRQTVSDAARLLGVRLPGYVAVYQRLTPQDVPVHPVNDGDGSLAATATVAPQWYGVSSVAPLVDTTRFEPVIQAAEDEVLRTAGEGTVAATRAAALASIIGWTQRVVFSTLADPRQPAAPWALYGAGWIDCGPSSGAGKPWETEVQQDTRVIPATTAASPLPWPMPQPLVQALPSRAWMSPRLRASGHALAIAAVAAAFAFWGAARNNMALLARVGSDLVRYSTIPASHDDARRAAVQTLIADRDQLDRYSRAGVPLHLSLGMYRGAALLAPLNRAIVSWSPPAPPPTVVTLDSMSLFDSGSARLKPDATRVMVNALEMIDAHQGKRILVAGHTDNVGNPASNLALSIARAMTVRDWLVGASRIPATQFAIQGYGDTRPVADNATPAGRTRNRRVEITLVPDLPPAQPVQR